MAFTDTQKKDIRKYLGVPFGFYELTTRLESMMDHVGENSTDQAEIETWLARLAEIDTALTGSEAETETFGHLKKVDEVEFHKPGSSEDVTSSIGLVKQGRVLINRLARALGVDDVLPHGDYFGTKQPVTFMVPLG
jgi:hypothetical protein